jgi:hypothetical protein
MRPGIAQYEQSGEPERDSLVGEAGSLDIRNANKQGRGQPSTRTRNTGRGGPNQSANVPNHLF